MMSEHKDIDKIFQQGAKQHDFEYNPDAWAEMELLLEKDKKSRRFWWWLTGLFVVGSIVVIGLLYYSDDSATLDSMPQQVVHTHSNSIRDVKSETNTQQIHEGNTSLEEKQTFDLNGEGIQTLKEVKSNKQSKTAYHVLAPNKIDIEYADEIVHSEHISDALSGKNKQAKSTSLEQGEKSVEQDEKNVKVERLELLPVLLPTLLVGDAPNIEVLGLTQNTNLKRPKSNNQWLVGVFLASELSSVELANVSRNNFRYGGQTSLRFKRKFGTSIGVSYTHKKYKVNEGDYTPPKGFWTRKIAPQSTEATTDILEVPVSVAFFPKGYENDGLYTSIGLTSYFMLKEKYHYSYDLSDPDLIRDWHTEKENNHWLGMGQFSVGYQRLMGEKVYAQFGSYVQVPLTGIGHGNVKLWSFGLNWKMNFLIK